MLLTTWYRAGVIPISTSKRRYKMCIKMKPNFLDLQYGIAIRIILHCSFSICFIVINIIDQNFFYHILTAIWTLVLQAIGLKLLMSYFLYGKPTFDLSIFDYLIIRTYPIELTIIQFGAAMSRKGYFLVKTNSRSILPSKNSYCYCSISKVQ